MSISKASCVGTILSYFRTNMPSVTTELRFGSDFQLLVAVILSAQCTDARVNQVTPTLFRSFPDAQSMASASEDDLRQLISRISYPNAKARYLKGMATRIVTHFSGRVPRGRTELESLPGVGRKTAGVMLAVAFGKPEIPVDTHVFRVSRRLRLVPPDADTPEKVEMALHETIPRSQLADAHHWLLLHGRHICQSRKPKCHVCPFADFCPSARHESSK